MRLWNAIRARLIRLLGGERVSYFHTERLVYRPIATPIDLEGWEKLATLYTTAPDFFGYLHRELTLLDQDERKIPAGPEGDRDRLRLSTRRACILDILEIPSVAAKEAAKILTAERALQRKEKGVTPYVRHAK